MGRKFITTSVGLLTESDKQASRQTRASTLSKRALARDVVAELSGDVKRLPSLWLHAERRFAVFEEGQ